MGNFIEDEISNNKSNNHEYEDVIVQGQIIEAKNLIKDAIRNNKNSVIWCYDYDYYDSMTLRIDNIFKPSYNFADYKISHVTAGELNRYATVFDYLYNIVYKQKGGGPRSPISFDYAYVERRIKKELQTRNKINSI